MEREREIGFLYILSSSDFVLFLPKRENSIGLSSLSESSDFCSNYSSLQDFKGIVFPYKGAERGCKPWTIWASISLAVIAV